MDNKINSKLKNIEKAQLVKYDKSDFFAESDLLEALVVVVVRVVIGGRVVRILLLFRITFDDPSKIIGVLQRPQEVTSGCPERPQKVLTFATAKWPQKMSVRAGSTQRPEIEAIKVCLVNVAKSWTILKIQKLIFFPLKWPSFFPNWHLIKCDPGFERSVLRKWSWFPDLRDRKKWFSEPRSERKKWRPLPNLADLGKWRPESDPDLSVLRKCWFDPPAALNDLRKWPFWPDFRDLENCDDPWRQISRS